MNVDVAKSSLNQSFVCKKQFHSIHCGEVNKKDVQMTNEAELAGTEVKSPEEIRLEAQFRKWRDFHFNITISDELNELLCDQLVEDIAMIRVPGNTPASGGVWLSVPWYNEDKCGLPQFANVQEVARAANTGEKSKLVNVALSPELCDAMSKNGIYSSKEPSFIDRAYYLQLDSTGLIRQVYQSLSGSRPLMKLSTDKMQRLDQKLTDQFIESHPLAFREEQRDVPRG